MGLSVVPVFQRDRAKVQAFIRSHHRHHRAPLIEVIRLACVDDEGRVRGVLTLSNPVGRMWDDGWTLEITRVATDGARNACSLLYGAARRVAWVMGCRRIVTYTLPEEGGVSLRAAGWTCDGTPRKNGIGWSSRPGRTEAHPARKTRWVCHNPKAWDGEVTWPEVEQETLPLLTMMEEK